MAHIILPTDLSDHSLNAADAAFHLYTAADDRFTVLHVHMDPVRMNSSWVDVGGRIREAAQEGLDAFLLRVNALPGAPSSRIHGMLASGPPAPTLCKAALELKADVVVMGTLGKGGNRFIGSTALDVIENGRIPVLVIPSKARMGRLQRILFADEHTDVPAAALSFVVDLAGRTKAEVLVGHVMRTADEEPDAHVLAVHEALLASVPHRYTALEGQDPAAALDLLADEEKADLIALVRRPRALLGDLFRTSTSKRLVLESTTPLLVLQHGAEGD
jgi:nucleotide-binding universal stress UspA family protein